MISSFLLHRAALSGIYGQCHTFKDSTITDALFVYLGGTPSAESIAAVDENFRKRPLVCLTPEWQAHIQKSYPDAKVFTRTLMAPVNRFVIPEVLLPGGYTVMPFDANAFDRHPFGHGENYADFVDFEANGVGAVVWHNGEIVASASSFLTLDKEIELDVSTLEAHRGKGLASACIALMLQNCAQRGITVHWDAQNDTSRHLAEKFGFRAEFNYSVYWLPEKEAPAMPRTLLTVTTDREASIIKTTNRPAAYLIEQTYTEEEYTAIRREADAWNVEVEFDKGEDYGYGRGDSTYSIFYREIGDDILVVRDGHFAGIVMHSSGTAFNKQLTVYDGFFIAFANKYDAKKAVLCARTGTSFSSDDHEKWDLVCYYLRKKCDNNPKWMK